MHSAQQVYEEARNHRPPMPFLQASRTQHPGEGAEGLHLTEHLKDKGTF